MQLFINQTATATDSDRQIVCKVSRLLEEQSVVR